MTGIQLKSLYNKELSGVVEAYGGTKLKSGNIRGAIKSSSGVALRFVNPGPSVMSTASDDGFFNSNPCMILANINCKAFRANEIPKQILLPLPNGINSKC